MALSLGCQSSKLSKTTLNGLGTHFKQNTSEDQARRQPPGAVQNLTAAYHSASQKVQEAHVPVPPFKVPPEPCYHPCVLLLFCLPSKLRQVSGLGLKTGSHRHRLLWYSRHRWSALQLCSIRGAPCPRPSQPDLLWQAGSPSPRCQPPPSPAGTSAPCGGTDDIGQEDVSQCSPVPQSLAKVPRGTHSLQPL